MNTMGISTKMSTPKKVGDKTQGVPSTSKSRGNVSLSTHGSVPMVPMHIKIVNLGKFRQTVYKIRSQTSRMHAQMQERMDDQKIQCPSTGITRSSDTTKIV